MSVNEQTAMYKVAPINICGIDKSFLALMVFVTKCNLSGTSYETVDDTIRLEARKNGKEDTAIEVMSRRRKSE